MFARPFSRSETLTQLSLGAIFLTFLLAAGCVEVVDRDESDQQGKKAPQTMNETAPAAVYNEWIVSNSFYRIKGLPGQFNQYLLQVSNQASVQSFSQGRAAPMMDSPSEKSRTYQIQGGVAFHLQTPQGSVQAVVPQDIMINETLMAPPQNPEWIIESSGRIFLGEKANLISLDKKLTLKAHEIVFDRSVLQNFRASDVASSASNGRSGGDIYVVAQKISGVVFIELRGEQGGGGLVGAQPADARDFNVTLQRGGTGGRGGRGGDSGNLIVEAMFFERSDFRVRFFAGLGGDGGAGGEGQKALSFGGGCLASLNRGGAPCPPPPRDEEIPRGPRGARGDQGTSGIEGKFCFPENGKITCVRE